MRSRRVLLGLLAGLSACFVPRVAAAADKAAAACIQSAEDGERAQKAGELLHARELFAQCAARECPTLLRRDCSSWIEDADRQIPSVVLGAHDGQGRDVVDARASIDGTVVREHLDGNEIALDPGAHVVRFETAGAPPVEMHVVLRAGEKNRAILATLGPTPPPAPAVVPSPAPAAPPATKPHDTRHIPAGAWILGGIGVVGFGVFAYFGVTGANDASNLRSTCAPGCADSQVKDARMKLITADSGLGVGVLSLAAGTWIAIRGLTRPESTSAWQLVVAPTPNAARATLVVRF